jgi:ZIP family zinc transporter
MDGNVLLAFIFTLLAGLSTGIGSALAFFTNRTNTRFLAASLGFSAGVMIYVSFVELLNRATQELIRYLGDARLGTWAATGAFFVGMALIAIIDKFVPEAENPHEAHTIEEMRDVFHCDHAPSKRKPARTHDDTRHLMRTGAMTALVIGIHNFPEGLAAFMSAMQDTTIGLSVSISIAVHNIPEGIAVSIPIYYATGSRRKAFRWSFLSGLAEPLGALTAYLVLMPFMTPVVSGMILAGVAGIMVFISLDELLPSAEKYGEHHLSVYGAGIGMMVMAASLSLL